MKSYYIIILSGKERDKKGLDIDWVFGIYDTEEEAMEGSKTKPDWDCTLIKHSQDETFSFDEFMQKYLPAQYEKEKIAKLDAYEKGKYFAKKSITKHAKMFKLILEGKQ